MGYYTNYSLEVRSKDSTREISYNEMKVIEERFNNLTGYDFSTMLEYGEEGKWYHHDEDMIQLSKEFPQYLFVLEGEGEERTDWWIHTYWNGQMGESSAKLIEPEIVLPQGFVKDQFESNFENLNVNSDEFTGPDHDYDFGSPWTDVQSYMDGFDPWGDI